MQIIFKFNCKIAIYVPTLEQCNKYMYVPYVYVQNSNLYTGKWLGTISDKMQPNFLEIFILKNYNI